MSIIQGKEVSTVYRLFITALVIITCVKQPT